VNVYARVCSVTFADVQKRKMCASGIVHLICFNIISEIKLRFLEFLNANLTRHDRIIRIIFFLNLKDVFFMFELQFLMTHIFLSFYFMPENIMKFH